MGLSAWEPDPIQFSVNLGSEEPGNDDFTDSSFPPASIPSPGAPRLRPTT